MQLHVHSTINDLSAKDWDTWFGGDYPFLRHDFLRGLEEADCTTAASGWQPCHLVLRNDQDTVAAAPGFLKSHSYGEYVFDWSWADAWQRQGLSYYPKLITAAPFTPATGPRVYTNPAYPKALEQLLPPLKGCAMSRVFQAGTACLTTSRVLLHSMPQACTSVKQPNSTGSTGSTPALTISWGPLPAASART